jgi:site-specific DNA recombinase
MAPLGYDTKDRRITVNAAEADRVRTIFRSYLRLGSLSLLLADLHKQGIVTKVRTLKSGATVGGIAFTRGPLAHLLRNRFYIGEVVFKGEVLAGEQPAIVDRDLFDAVQAKLTKQANSQKTARIKSKALLVGRIFDDRGNRMTPSHVRKRGIKYRYYLSSALLQSQPGRAGDLSRVPAAEIERLLVRSVRDHLNQSAEIEDAALINTHVARVEVQSKQLVIELVTANGIAPKRPRRRNALKVPWHKMPSRRRREILVPASVPPRDVRPIRSESRALLIASIARGRRWLNELIADPMANAQSIATRHGCSVRTRARQGGDRRTPSAWDGGCLPRRPACRMVLPVPYARASGAIAPHSNRVSADRGLRCRETGFCRQRPTSRNGLAETVGCSQRPRGSTQARKRRAFLGYPGNLR